MSVYSPERASILRMALVYRHPFGYYGSPYSDRALPANERNICALSATLRAKPGWWTKSQDPTIRAKWREEATGAPPPYGEIPLERNEVEYVLDELKWYAARRDEETGIEPSIYFRIWQSDNLVDESLRAQLIQHVSALEDVPDEAKDWHPQSDGRVLDLVHPSLYCVVYGRTIVRNGYDPSALTIQKPPLGLQPGDINDTQDRGRTGYFLSNRFSWLPTDFSISPDGNSAKALGYINNLNPYTHRSMYPVIERFVARFVPLWERVLAESQTDTSPPQRTVDDYEWVPKGAYDSTDSEDEYKPEDEDYFNHDNHNLRLPSLRLEVPREAPAVNLKGRTLQVIVKLANIYLTPEKPHYPGGSWHVEGMINEGIVSTGLYYYDEENITQSSLAFRVAVEEPLNLGQDDEQASQLMYGFGRGEPLNQVLGSVVTKQGRCLAFPNVYQHQVQPFELADKSKPGHRKILALFLVDPALEKPRPSTSDIPPQQPDVMRLVLQRVSASLPADESGQKKGFSKLPMEMLDMIVEQADWLMTRKEAEAYRLELMEERKVMVKKNDEQMFAEQFNMCEH